MPRGGARPGAGKKKGTKHKATIEREVARKNYEQRILAELDPLIRSQLDLAKGVSVMYARDLSEDKNGTKKPFGPYKLVTSLERIEQILNGDGVNGEDYFYVTSEKPDGKVLENLMSRVFGKAEETIKHDVTKDVKESLEKLSLILP